MNKLLELQDKYIEALKREITKPVKLLTLAKYAMGNFISDCRIEGCTRENRCNSCVAWSKVWDEIDAYLEENR